MQKLSIALLFVASAAGAQRLVPDPAFARLPGSPLRITDSLRIDTRAAKLEAPLGLFPGPHGGLVVYSQWRSVTFFDSTGRRMWSKGTDRERREVGEVTQFGWQGNEMWVSDAAWSQIAILDQYGNVTKSLELPSWVRPPFSNRRSFPVFESMFVLGRYDDGEMLVRPRGDNIKLGSGSTFDQNAVYLVRINEDGIIQRTVAKFPSPTMRIKEKDGNEFVFQNPLNQWLFRASPDGKRVVIVNIDTMNPKVDTVVVRAIGERGDTAWTQKFAYPALSYTDAQVDSIGRTRWGNDTEYRERRTRHMPRRAQAVWDFTLDIDKSMWLTLRGNGSTRPVVGIDATGKVIGKFLLPARRSVRAANLGGLWTAEIRSDVRGDLVRYRVAK